MYLMTSQPNAGECLFTDSTQFTSLEDLEHNLGNEYTSSLPYGDQKKYWGNQTSEKTIKQLFTQGLIESE